MATIRPRLIDDRIEAMRELALAAPDDPAARDALAAFLRDETGLGPGRLVLADGLDRFLDVPRTREAAFWEHQEVLADAVRREAAAAAGEMAAFLPPGFTGRHDLTIHLLPGISTCYGLAGGGQIFGLYDHATPEETVLFLEHTYYHELSGHWDTPRLTAAERAASTADGLLTWTLALIRNEGIANIAVLEKLLTLRQKGVRFGYFTYAGLIGDDDATRKAMLAFRQLVGGLSPETAERVSVNISRVLKNPRLPVINLIGIHMAQAIIAAHGLPVLLDVEGQEPEDFFALYADTADPLLPALLGDDRELAPRVCRLAPTSR